MITEAMLWESLCSRHGTAYVRRMRDAEVAVAGLGGLGSNVALLLVRMGVGRLHLIDYDVVDLSNLNRQQYVLSDIGKYKTEAMQDRLRQINPFVSIKAECVRLTEDNITDVFACDGLICESLDAAASKAMLVNGILGSFKDKKIVAASGMAGTGSANEIVTRKVNDRLYICGDGRSDCDKQPLTAARASLCAAHQANIISRIILGLE